MTAKSFASTEDTAEKKVSFDQIGSGLYAYTAEGDPNSGIIVGDDGVMVIDAQATPAMADDVIARVAKVTDKPIKYVLLTHYHAVRTHGASAYKGAEILASDTTRGLIAERGKQDMDSEIGRFPRLFRTVESIPGLTWPTVTFPDQISVWLGRREVRITHVGRGHTAGDVIAVVPDAGVVFSGDLVEYKSACYCGDAHFTDWPATLDNLAELQAVALVPGRGAALTTPEMVAEGIALTSDFIAMLYGSVSESVAKGRSLKDAFDFVRLAMDPKFKTFAIYEHCLPFNVVRAYDEARGIEWPVIWTAERDREMWAALQGEDLARADDGDDVAGVAAAAAGAAGRDRAGDVIAVDLAVGRGRGELVRLAIGVGRRRAALVAGRQAAVDAIAVAVIGDDEHAPFRLRGAGETDAQNGGESDQECTHDKARLLGGAPFGTDDKNASKIVKGRLTVSTPARRGLGGP